MADLRTYRSIINHVAALQKDGPVVVLDSYLSTHPAAESTWLAASPQRIVTADGSSITEIRNGRTFQESRNPWDFLHHLLEQTSSWWFGYLGYDLKNYTEQLQSNNEKLFNLPDFFLMEPGLLLQWPAGAAEPNVIKDELPHISTAENDSKFLVGEPIPGIEKSQYMQHIQDIQRLIREGSFYEMNYSYPLSGSFEGNPLALYKAMMMSGPVPFGAYLSLNDTAVCCASPERFLAKDESRVWSQPIKGTAGRSADTAVDNQFKQELRSSTKDQAENLMIVDLVRNDLNRVARKGTVRVPSLYEIQTFESVHQMVSTVECSVEKDTNPADIIKACFPMGSMTGAPKISVMQTIENLEVYRRGIYSGAIGYITPDRNFDFNVVIRSAIVQNNTYTYPVGGAITSDSDPEKEWEETIVKARALTHIDTDPKTVTERTISE